MIRLSHGEAYLPHDKGNGAAATRLASNKSSYLASGFDQSTTSQDVSRILGSLSTSPDSKYSVKFERHLFWNHILLAIIFCLTELNVSTPQPAQSSFGMNKWHIVYFYVIFVNTFAVSFMSQLKLSILS